MDTMVMEDVHYVLSAADRCDRCIAQAYVWVNGVAGDLQFCKSHFERYEEKIRSYAFEVVDERDKLNVKVASSV